MPNAHADGVVKLRRDAAEQLGVSSRQLGDWSKAAWFPPHGRTADGWDVAAIRAARDAHGRKGSDVSALARNLKIKTDHEKLKQAELKTQKERIALDIQRGDLIPRAALELFAASLLTGLADSCDQLPDLVASEAPKKYRRKIRDRVTAELNQIRRQLAADLERAARDFDTRHQEGTNGEENPG